MPRIVVCTFATEAFAGSAEVLRHTALHAGGADEVIVYREADVAPWFEQYPELLRGETRGYGWWSWKPWCILETLRRRAAPGDVVVYADAAMAFEAPLAAHASAVRHALLFRLGGWRAHDYRNRAWTKRDAFAMMGCADDEHRDGVQLNAALQVYRRTPQALAFLERYLDWCARREVIDDARVLENYAGFVDHRHDQSILSLLSVGCADADVARDPTQYGVDDPELTPVPGEPRPRLVDHHRARRRPVRIAVITPSVGDRHLRECVGSVQAQDLPNVVHYLVADGPRAWDAVAAVAASFAGRMPIHVLRLPHNVGANGWNGHRVYGALPWLVDADLVAFLDEDNAFDADHLRHLAKALVAGNAEWAHSLRRVVDAEGRDVCPDNCESLGGLYHTVCGPGDYLVDTSCYLLRRDVAIRVAHAWNRPFRNPTGLEADRELARLLLSSSSHVAVRRHSVRYRLGSTGASVSADFFLKGNETLGTDFAGRPDLFVFHFSPAATADLLSSLRRRDRSYALDEWQRTLLKGLGGSLNLLNAYECAPNIPRGAAVFVSICQPDQVPWELLRERRDLWRVAYTLESPNIRHAEQWDPVRLAACFDVVLTYWQPLLDDPRVATLFCPHNTHHLDLDDPLDRSQLRVNRCAGRAACMVLERRDLAGRYSVPNLPGVQLRCLDPLRALLVRDLHDVTVYGSGWDAAALPPNVKLGHALHRSLDPRHAVDIMSDFSFVVIVENCDAEGYASEKLYDALMAGAVPLYYGSVPAVLQIPEGPERGVYLDVRRRFAGVPDEGLSAAVRDLLAGLSDDQVAAWKARVAALRERILRRVGTESFAGIVRHALDMRRTCAATIPRARRA